MQCCKSSIQPGFQPISIYKVFGLICCLLAHCAKSPSAMLAAGLSSQQWGQKRAAAKALSQVAEGAQGALLPHVPALLSALLGVSSHCILPFERTVGTSLMCQLDVPDETGESAVIQRPETLRSVAHQPQSITACASNQALALQMRPLSSF